MKILNISRWYPYPADNGSKIRILNLIKQLASAHEVELISFVSESDDHLGEMQRYCSSVKVVPYKPFQPGRLKALLAFFSSKPRSVVDTYSLEMERLVKEAQTQHHYDVVIAYQIDVAPYCLLLPTTPKIIEEIELTTMYEQYAKETQFLRKIRRGLMWWKRSRYTADVLSQFNGCTVVSTAEQKLIRQVSSGSQPIAIIPNGVDVAHYAADFGLPEADSLIYSGALSFYANFDAMQFFIGEILPLIQAERPQVKLSITGKRDKTLADRLPVNTAVTFTGYLEDIRPTVARSWICVVPLRLGGGTRLKILEALATGTTVVSTTKGAEGLDLIPDHDLLIADSSPDFAAAVVRLLKDATLRERLSRHGRQTVKAKYDWQIIGQQFNRFVEQVATS